MQRIKDVLDPHPSLAIVQFWQGKVELVLRSAVIVLCFITFICAAVASSNTTFSFNSVPSGNQTITDLLALRDSTHGLAGWVIFCCFVGMIYEGIVIGLRFLNLAVLDQYIGIFLITDIVIHVLFSISVFIEGIVFSVFGSTTWASLQTLLNSIPQVPFGTIESSCKGSGAFLLLSFPLFVALVVWIGVWLFARWQQKITRILRVQSGPTDQDTEDLDPSQEDY